MATAGETRIHERLDELFGLVGDIDKNLAVVSSGCEPCRGIVVGNGGRLGIDKRVDRLEEARKGRGKLFWIMVASAASLAVSIISGTAVGAVLLSLGK